MRRGLCLFLGLMIVGSSNFAYAGDSSNTVGWERIDSRYCTVWLAPGVDAGKVNRQVNTRWIKFRYRADKGNSPKEELGAKCDMIFKRAQELLDMYPPGIHVTWKITADKDYLQQVHKDIYGHGVDTVSFYLFQDNTIYSLYREVSESVVVHEMAHCIIDHYFKVRPPRKIEEVLAMYADEHLRD